MKRIFLLAVMMLIVFSVPAQAALQTIGTATYVGTDYNLIYDNDSQLTWLDYSNGSSNWDNQMSWAAGLNTAGVLTYNFNAGVSMSWSDGWRLPAVYDIGNDGCNYGFDGTDCGYNVDTSTGEMAHLYYDELENISWYNTNIGRTACYATNCMTNTGDFQNLLPYSYFSGTAYSDSTEQVWVFHAWSGVQFENVKALNLYAIAVRPGDVSVAVVPEPISSALFLVGAVTLGVRRFRKRIS